MNTRPTLFAPKFLFLSLSFLSQQAYSAIVLDVDFVALTAGIQSSTLAGPGQTINANIVLSVTQSSTLSAYQFSVLFDHNELEFVSRTETFPVGFGFVETDPTNTNNLGLGQLYRFGADSGAGPVAPAGPFVVASLQFRALSLVGTVGDNDIAAARLVAQDDDFLVNGTFAVIPDSELVFNSGSVSAVPEPTSLALLVGMAVVMVRRRYPQTALS